MSVEEKFRRNLSPVMLRAILCGNRLREYPYEKVDAKQYVRLEKLVKEIEKFFESRNKND